MKAVICTKYGPPEVLQLREVEKPVPADNQVLVTIHATTVSAGDVIDRTGEASPWAWLPMRAAFGFTKPRRRIPGAELAGEIEAVGREVKRFRPGDQVFGNTGWGSGAYAQYKCLPENAVLVHKPANISYGEAAAVPFGGMTAFYFLRRANIQNGQEVLIYGASGGIGTFSVQLAKYYGAEVTAVCSAANFEMVQSLGADKVIDYTKEDFAQSRHTYDVIFDTVRKSSFSHCKGSLKAEGFYLSTDMGLALMFQSLWTPMTGIQKVVSGIASNRTEDLNYLRELLEAGQIKSVIDRSYPLEQVVEAHRYVEKGHKKGNVVIVVGHESEA
jgi:NADPH:quinone reductase-like Zn-dependent oxidoreductase